MTGLFELPATPDNPPYYGWLMLLAVVLSLVFWSRLARLDDRLLLVYLGALAGAFLGAKMIYVLAEGWRDFAEPDRWRRLATGKTILGALLGGYAGVELSKKLIGYPRATGDWFAMIVPASIVLGRIGCLLHGCCLGNVCESFHWWTLTDRSGIPRWPAVPVEIAFNLAVIGIFWIFRKRHWFAGQHFHLYLIAYGLFRFVHEFGRATPRILGPFSGYQLAALAVTALGTWRFHTRQLSEARSTPATRTS
ncbi:MAG: prolipoprotein diacylglyceryl transferase family protein [Verrucomicrobiota bacterium]